MPESPKVFFVHIMRTGGGTFYGMINANFRAGEVYPDPRVDLDMAKANIEISYLLKLPAERRQEIRVYSGHFPFFVTELLEPDLLTATLLREPVQRTISFLQTRVREANHRIAPEDLYIYPGLNASQMANFQVKQFAMTTDDHVNRAIDVIDIDDDRLALAQENLAKIDVLGLHERYDEFLEAVTKRFGWDTSSVDKWHVSEPVEIPDSLRRQIIEDNAADLAFYDHAVKLYERRRAAEHDSRPGEPKGAVP